jgi:hypothetical protein
MNKYNQNTGKKNQKGAYLTGNHANKNYSNTDFWEATFENFIGKGTDFSNSEFQSAKIINADFRGADFSGAEYLHTVTGLSTALFNDDTKIDDVDLELIARREPIITRRLRTIRYVGRIKRNYPHIYWLWWLICDCGRSWIRLLISIVGISFVFTLVYFIGTKFTNSFFLPHIFLTGEPINLLPSFYQCFQFSALTLASFNMPNIIWYTTKTGIWIIVEVWTGFMLLSALVSVIATKIAKNE